jgi:hypothetical protein
MRDPPRYFMPGLEEERFFGDLIEFQAVIVPSVIEVPRLW